MTECSTVDVLLQLQRQQEIGEVTYIWPDPEDSKSQVQLSAIVQAMESKGAAAIVRYVSKNGSEPKIGLAKPMTWKDEKLNVEFLYWVKVSFAVFFTLACSDC